MASAAIPASVVSPRTGVSRRVGEAFQVLVISLRTTTLVKA